MITKTWTLSVVIASSKPRVLWSRLSPRLTRFQFDIPNPKYCLQPITLFPFSALCCPHFKTMNKRQRPAEFEVNRGQVISGVPASQCKRIKLASQRLDKENVPYSRSLPATKSSTLHSRKNNLRNATLNARKSRKPPHNGDVLRLKVDKTSNLIVAHPISKHIIKSNLYNDEGWIGQQQQLFVAILNDILESQQCKTTLWKVDALENARASAFEYYQTQDFQNIVKLLNTVRSFWGSFLISRPSKIKG